MATLLGAYFGNLEFSNCSQPFGFVPKRIKRGMPPKLEYVIWENYDIWWLSDGFCSFAMFCHVFPIISPAFWWDSGAATGSIWSPNPDMEHPGPEPRAGEAAKARKLSHRKLQVHSGPYGSTGGFSSGYERDSQFTDEENPTLLFLVIAEKNNRKTQTNHQPTGVWQPLLIEYSQSWANSDRANTWRPSVVVAFGASGPQAQVIPQSMV